MNLDPERLPADYAEKLASFKRATDLLTDNDIAENCSEIKDGFYMRIIRPIVGVEDDDGMPTGVVQPTILAVFHLTDTADPNVLEVEVLGFLMHDHMKLTIEE